MVPEVVVLCWCIYYWNRDISMFFNSHFNRLLTLLANVKAGGTGRSNILLFYKMW